MDRAFFKQTPFRLPAANSYICPTSQLRARDPSILEISSPKHISSLPTRRSLTSRTKNVYLIQRANLHTASAKRELEYRADSHTADSITGDLPIRRYWGKEDRKTDHHIPGKSFIRDRLRAWSVQNEINKKEDAPEGVAETGRVKTLPEALFLEDVDEIAAEDEDETLADYDELVKGNVKAQLVPGDLLEIKLNSVRRQLAVYIGYADNQAQFLLSDGRWAVDLLKFPSSLILHNYATTEEIEAIRRFVPKRAVRRQTALGIGETVGAAGDVSPEISAPVIQRMRELIAETAAFYRLHVDTLDNLFETVADEKNYISLGFTDLVKQVFGKDYREMSDGALLAIFRALQRDTVKTQTINGPLPEQMTVLLTPKNLIRQFEMVTEWARDFQECSAQLAVKKNVYPLLKKNPLQQFAMKARKLIEKSRKIRAPTTIGVLGPTRGRGAHEGDIELKDTEVEYTENDKMILEFLWNTYLRLPMTIRKNRSHSIGSMILRAVGGYPTLRLERKIGRLLLQEMGSLAPWSESMDETTTLPIPGRRGAHIANQLEEETMKLAADLGLSVDRPEKLPMVDTMANLRKDWAETEVLCIDKAATRMLDDGISVEPAADIPGAYWLHVHIAHPSAFIGPGHLFAQRGRLFGASMFTSRKSYNMMPLPFAMSLSLAPQKPVMTVSSLVLENGDVQEVKITVGTVRKVTQLDPRAVDHVLGKPPAEKAVMMIGSEIPPLADMNEDDVALAIKHAESLRIVERLSKARVKRRQQLVPEFADFEFAYGEMDIASSFLEPYDSARLLRSYHYLGDPTIKVTSDRYLHTSKVSERQLQDSTTARMMILASESAGRWLRERGIPVVYTGSLTHPEYPLSRLNKLSKHDQMLWPMPIASSDPTPHVMLTVDQYARVTSPLRRYTDILAMWQIDAFLKAEANNPSNICPTASGVDFPFSKEMIDEYIRYQQRTITDIDKLMKRSQIHWAFQAMFRAFHFKEAPLPEVWDCQVLELYRSTDPDDSQLRGQVIPFTMRAVLLKSAEGWEKMAKLNQYLPVKLQMVDTTIKKLYVRAVGPPSDLPTQTGPIRISSVGNKTKASHGPGKSSPDSSLQSFADAGASRPVASD